MLENIILSIAFLMLSGVAAYACECGRAQTLLGEIEAADAVMLVKFTKFYPFYGQTVESPIPNADVEVKKAYKGNIKAGDDLVFGRGQPKDCNVFFAPGIIGKEMLVYAKNPKDADKPLWYVSSCTRSRRVEMAAEDLLYLDALPESEKRTRISGTIERNTYNEHGLRMFPATYIEGVKVRITGGKIDKTLTTDKNGVFEVYGLPPGDYDVEIQPTDKGYAQRATEYRDEMKDGKRILRGKYYGYDEMDKQPPAQASRYQAKLIAAGHLSFQIEWKNR